MSKKFLNKITFLLSIPVLFYGQNKEALSQTSGSTFKERNLSETIVKSQIREVSENNKIEPEKNLQNSILLEQMKTGIAAILLNEKLYSLMFEEGETKNVDRAIEALKNNQNYNPEENANQTKEPKETKLEENKKSHVYLASIIYLNPQYWVVWISEKKITSENNRKDKEIYLKMVDRDHVKVVWKLGLSKWKALSNKSEDMAPTMNEQGEVEIEFELKPNQTYNLTSGKIIEGKVSIAANSVRIKSESNK